MMIRRWKSDLFKSDLFIPADGSASVFRPRTSADNAANNKSNECIGVAVLKEGQTYTVTLSADPSVSSFIVVPQSPLPAAQPTTNPLQFSLTLPTSITPGIFTIGAVGFTSRGLAQPCSPFALLRNRLPHASRCSKRGHHEVDTMPGKNRQPLFHTSRKPVSAGRNIRGSSRTQNRTRLFHSPAQQNSQFL